MEDKKVLLSIKDLKIKFQVRGRTLTAIRGISLDIYENESIAIVGESAAGKSVFTKTFAGMLDDNGYIDNGSIIFNDPTLADTTVDYDAQARSKVASMKRQLDRYSKLELGAATYREMLELKSANKARTGLSEAETQEIDAQISDLTFQRTELYNLKQTIDPSKEKARVKETAKQISALDDQIKALKNKKETIIHEHREAAKKDTGYEKDYEQKLAALQKRYAVE